MSDVVVTVPKSFLHEGKRGLEGWIAEGDAAGEPWTGESWQFFLGGYPPSIESGERVYVVYNGKLRGYAPLVRLRRFRPSMEEAQAGRRWSRRGYSLIRQGGAVAVTIDDPIPGFRGFRYRWWDRSVEKPFSGWRKP